ncbi:hypothetical protein MCM1_2658 [Methanosarcina barkeri CM1]|uniref:Uncharacterized protein n=1 Tax=Methanosarcina barkeri CM1 TaxID=796385 RepID=A0A0G3CCD9_METBA|nr:hypothetical protein MCM1_2658 [Methanosarcina barkeri CM1]
MIQDEKEQNERYFGKQKQNEITARVVNSKEIRKPDGSGKTRYLSSRKLFSQVI